MLCEGVVYAIGGGTLFFHKIREDALMIYGAMLYNPCIYYTSEWFVARRGFANGVIFAGTAAGGLFFPLVLPRLLDRFGTSTTLRILSIAFAVVLLPSLPFIRGRLPQAKVTGPMSRFTGSETERSKKRGWMKSATFRFLMIANTIQAFG